MFASICIGIAAYLGVGALHIRPVMRFAKEENARLSLRDYVLLVVVYPIIWVVCLFDRIRPKS